MKPVLVGLCLILILISSIVSASLEDCPTCVYAYDSDDLIGTNPYYGCPTCVFAYDSNGSLINTNPYIGCPICVFYYDSNGSLITYYQSGCSSCSLYYSTSNTHVACPSCSFSSPNSPAVVRYTFPNGSQIPDDYICPIHGIYCPDDPRPLELRPGYIAPSPTIKPTIVPRIPPDTSWVSDSIFNRPSLFKKSHNFEYFRRR